MQSRSSAHAYLSENAQAEEMAKGAVVNYEVLCKYVRRQIMNRDLARHAVVNGSEARMNAMPKDARLYSGPGS